MKIRVSFASAAFKPVPLDGNLEQGDVGFVSIDDCFIDECYWNVCFVESKTVCV